jgi:hypothetical protein
VLSASSDAGWTSGPSPPLKTSGEELAAASRPGAIVSNNAKTHA